MERETGLEPATIYMASRCATTELLPQSHPCPPEARRDRSYHGPAGVSRLLARSPAAPSTSPLARKRGEGKRLALSLGSSPLPVCGRGAGGMCANISWIRG